MDPETPPDDQNRTMTLEAFADTIIPGEKRFPGDRAVAGACPGGGAVAAGAIAMLRTTATGISDGLDDYADLLNEHARAHAAEHGLDTDPVVPPFVALDFTHRTALVRALTAPGHPEKPFWVLLALFSNMAFDSAAHMSTVDAIAEGHPGLTAMGFSPPDSDGLWRFSAHSYGRVLADVHPDTDTSTGSLT